MLSAWKILVALTLAVFASTSASAMMLTFDDNGGTQDGTLSYAGGAAPLVGSGIDIFGINPAGTPLNPDVDLDCACELNFTTGNNTGTSDPWVFGGGGTFVITGNVTDPTNGNALVASGTILSGSWTEADISNVGPFGFLVGAGIDEKNEDLLDFYGISNPFNFGTTNITTGNISVGPNGSFTAVVSEVDVINTVVPAPATLALLGLGLVGFGIGRRNRC